MMKKPFVDELTVSGNEVTVRDFYGIGFDRAMTAAYLAVIANGGVSDFARAEQASV